MRSVGIREFRDQATRLLVGGEPIAIERHGQLVGLFIPVKSKSDDKARKALEDFNRAVEQVLAESGMTEEELSAALDLTRSH